MFRPSSINRTTDADSFRDTANVVFGATQAAVTTTKNFEVWARFAKLNTITLATGGTTTGFSLTYPESDFTRIQLAISGCGTSTVANQTGTVGNGIASVVSPGQAVRMDYGEGHERLTVRIPSSALLEKLAVLTGIQPRGMLDFQPEIDLNAPQARGLIDLVSLLDASSTHLPLVAIGEIEQAVVTSFLFASKHQFRHLLENDVPDTAPKEVRMAEEFIEANWRNPIYIEDIVATANVSARSLFRSFKAARGCSPMAFVKSIRLNHAKRLLSTSDPNTTVVGIALYCGFSNIGHFASDYKHAFGELPSATLLRARRR